MCEPLATADDPFADSRIGAEGFDDARVGRRRGYFDREGVWRPGDWPGGELGGRAVARRVLDAGAVLGRGVLGRNRRVARGRAAGRPLRRASRVADARGDAETAETARDDGFSRNDDALETLPGGSPERKPNPTTSAADVADALGAVAGLGSKFGGEARDDSDEMTEIGL